MQAPIFTMSEFLDHFADDVPLAAPQVRVSFPRLMPLLLTRALADHQNGE
jgi:hypothetical protein